MLDKLVLIEIRRGTLTSKYTQFHLYKKTDGLFLFYFMVYLKISNENIAVNYFMNISPGQEFPVFLSLPGQ